MSMIKRLFEYCYDRDPELKAAIDKDDYETANKIMVKDYEKYHDDFLKEINND